MTINVLDWDVNNYYILNHLKKDADGKNLDTQTEGVDLKVYDSSGNTLFSGIVWPNEQYEYDAPKSGEYKVCISMTPGMFIKNYDQIKTQVKFASEFHRDKAEYK